MTSLHRAVAVLQVADVERSARWYADVLGFAADTFPDRPPYGFAILRRDDAEIMLQSACPGDARPRGDAPDPELLWTLYVRAQGTTILDLAADVATRTPLLRGPERMFYGLVEFELCDPDGYRVAVGGEAPPGARVPERAED